MADLRNFNPECSVCGGSGTQQIISDAYMGITEDSPCPACTQLQITQALYIGLLKILNYGIGQPNQQIIRQFHSETIEIARRTLEECAADPDMFPNLKRLE